MKRIWLVRHGQSLGQLGKASHLDPVLSDLGRQQAQRLRDRLCDIDFDHVFISPFHRARETFELSGLSGKNLAFDSRLLECDFHVLGYLKHVASLLPYSTPTYARPDCHNAWTMPTAQRVRSLVDDLVTVEGDEILLVAHWCVFGMLLMTFLGSTKVQEPFGGSQKDRPCSWGAGMDNCAVSILGIGDAHPFHHRLLLWNDTHHVRDLLHESVTAPR